MTLPRYMRKSIGRLYIAWERFTDGDRETDEVADALLAGGVADALLDLRKSLLRVDFENSDFYRELTDFMLKMEEGEAR